MDQHTILELERVSRTFPGVIALDDVSLDLRAGEVHAIVGENGAGKSTLINLIAGVLQPDCGLLRLGGSALRLSDPVVARSHGIVTVHQEADFFPTLSVAENMALFYGLPRARCGRIDWAEIHASARRAVDAVGERIDVRQPASRLSVAHRHMTQISAALTRGAKVVILDEPTSALTAEEGRWLFEQIARLKSSGAGVIYISHRQEEVFELADRITVLRDGRRIWTRDRADVDRTLLIEAMVGRELEDSGRRPAAGPFHANDGLRVRGLSDARGRFEDVDLDVRAGEIVGLYGLVGAGRTELAHGIFGLRRLSGGTVEVDGVVRSIRSPRGALDAGIAYLPEDRLREGIFRGLSVRANTVISTLRELTLLRAGDGASRGGDGGALRRAGALTRIKAWTVGALASRGAEQRATASVTERLALRCRSIEQPVGQLSGGNQQKVVLGRWLLTKPKVLLLDEPTRGVDVGAKAEIHRLLSTAAADGCAVLLVSSELPEVLAHSDRVVVLREGKVAAELHPQGATAERVAEAALPAGSGSSTTVTARASTGEGRSTRPAAATIRGELGLLGIVALLGLWLGLTSEGFFESSNLGQLLADATLWTLLGLAAATVIIAGGIDISIGSLLALAAAAAGLVLKAPVHPVATLPLAALTALLVAGGGGLLNGVVSLVGRVHPIVVTLGMMIIYRGLVIALVSDRQISSLPEEFGLLAIHPASGFRASIVVGAVATALVYLLLGHTRIGRSLYAVGASASAARLAGISRARAWLAAFGIAGSLVGLAALLELSGSMQMQSQLARGWELQAIAVAVIGGVSITGGRGTVLGVVLGALLLRLVDSALVRWEIKGEQADLVVGGMILAAVLFDLLWRRRQR